MLTYMSMEERELGFRLCLACVHAACPILSSTKSGIVSTGILVAFFFLFLFHFEV